MPGTFRSPSQGPASRGGGCFLYVFCLFWTLISGTIFVLSTKGLLSTLHGGDAKHWVSTPCVLERFEIRENEADKSPRFLADAAYRYTAGGAERTGTQVWPGGKSGTDRYAVLGRVKEALLQGPEGPRPDVKDAPATCLVNPADATQAVLSVSPGAGGSDLLGGIIGMGFSGFFLLLGVLIFVSGRASRKRNASDDPKNLKSGAGVLVVFFLIFALAGSGVAIWMGSHAVEAVRMKSWQPVEATLISSRVSAHTGDDSTTYGIDLFYRYEVDGKTYHGDRYRIVGGSSSGSSSKQAYVAEHPPGSTLTAYYDPKDPWSVTVQRDWGGEAWWLLFPIPFLCVGFGGLIWTIKKIRQPQLASAPANFHAVKTRASANARRRRVAGQDPLLASGEWTKLRGVSAGVIAFLFIFALVWNGVTWANGGFGGNSPRNAFDWFHVLFMIPFVLVGVGVVVALIFAILGAGAASFEIKVDKAELAPGESTRLSWRRAGGRGQPRSLVLVLVGKEDATYANGSSNSIDTSIFHETKLYETTSKLAMQTGQVELAIPADAVPGFEGDSNSIRWQIYLLYDMGRWRQHSPAARLTVKLPPPFAPTS